MSKTRKPATLPRTVSAAGQAETGREEKPKKTESGASLTQTVITKNQQLEEQLRRALADYQNLERRVEEERRLLGQLTSVVLIKKFLPVLDNLESAQQHLKDQGLELVIGQFKDILSQEGVEEIPGEGVQFDPQLHEATEVVEGENDGLIVKVLRKGYKINERVLRPAQVTVERKKVDTATEEKAQKIQEFGDYA